MGTALQNVCPSFSPNHPSGAGDNQNSSEGISHPEVYKIHSPGVRTAGADCTNGKKEQTKEG